MERIHAGIAPIASHKGKRVYCHSAVKCDDSIYEDLDVLIQSFYDCPQWHDIQGEIVAVDMGTSYRYLNHEGKVREGHDYWDLMVWTVIDDCECGNEDTRNEQYEKGLPMDEPICGWHSYEFNYESVEFIVTV